MAAPPRRGRLKKALVVGINKFQYVNGLQGCINDTVNMKNILTSYFGFQQENIHSLTDVSATKANIIGELQWLLRDIRAEDTIVFHFSSHGSQLPDTSGDETTDHMDEILCCYDMNWSTGGYILDDDLAAFAHKVPAGVKVEALFDTCHSGTAHSVVPRGELTLLNEETPQARNMRPIVDRYLPPPPHIMAMMEDCVHTNRVLKGLTPLITGSTPLLGTVESLWSGCGEGETSADAFIGGKYNGAFTYYWCQIVRSAAGKISRNDLLKKLRAALVAGQYTQTPELTCSTAYSQGIILG